MLHQPRTSGFQVRLAASFMRESVDDRKVGIDCSVFRWLGGVVGWRRVG